MITHGSYTTWWCCLSRGSADSRALGDQSYTRGRGGDESGEKYGEEGKLRRSARMTRDHRMKGGVMSIAPLETKRIARMCAMDSVPKVLRRHCHRPAAISARPATLAEVLRDILRPIGDAEHLDSPTRISSRLTDLVSSTTCWPYTPGRTCKPRYSGASVATQGPPPAGGCGRRLPVSEARLYMQPVAGNLAEGMVKCSSN